MEVRGWNGKWLGAGDRRTVGVVRFDVVFELSSGVGKCGGRHVCVGGKHGSGSGRGSVNGKEGTDSGELAADFLFLNVEEMSDMLNHLLVGENHLFTGRAIRRRRGHNVGGIVTAIDGGQGAGRNKDGGRRTGHCWNGWTVV